MAADIEFNVRNGMTVGASKHMVLDVNGSLSARGFTLVSGQILSGGDDVLQIVDQQLVQPVDNKVNTMGAASADWNNTHTTVNSKSGYWETAFNWGDHASENYLTDYTVTVQDVTAHESSIEITESQITDLQSYLLASDIASASNWDTTYTTVTANSANWIDTDVSSPEKGEVLIYQSSTNKWTNKTDRASIESMYNYANTNFFSELSYDGTGKLTGVDVWVSSGKNTKLYERTFTYDTSDNLTTIVTKDVQGGPTRHTLTKTLAYDGNNNLTSVTRVYT